MNKLIIINGVAGVGKDTFVGLVKKYSKHNVINRSVISPVKKALFDLVGNYVKTDEYRSLLSKTCDLWEKHNDGPVSWSIREYASISNNSNGNIMFLHCREPNRISEISNVIGDDCETLLIDTKSRIKHVPQNESDKNVRGYDYDYVINNDGSIEALEGMAIAFAKLIDDKLISERSKSIC